MTEYLSEQFAAGCQPGVNPPEEFPVISDMLEHLDRDHAVKVFFGLECIDVFSKDIEVA